MQALVVRELSVARGDRVVLENVGFAVGAGTVLHVLGANGAGKTSLLEVLSGLREAEGGKIDGQPPAGELHWVGHRNGLHPALSPTENLSFWCRLQGVATDGIPAALERMGLGRLRHRPCGRLSTGQKRRTALARLLVIRRPWWFLDEPLAGLDVDAIALLGELLDEHARGAGAALVTSHQPLPRSIHGLEEMALPRMQGRRRRR